MENIVEYKDYGYSEIRNIICKIKEKYDFVQTVSIGQSVLGREIPAIKIGQAEEYVLYAAAFHSSERITATVLLKFVEEYCDFLMGGTRLSYLKAQKFFKDKGVIIVPVVNPDGMEIARLGHTAAGAFSKRVYSLVGSNTTHWNANARGVDINHNFPAGWEALHKAEQAAGIHSFAPTRFGGTRPASEPETAALINLCRKENIRHALAFHSQGNVIYYGFGDNFIPRGEKMLETMVKLTGYKAEKPSGLAVGGGFKDWFISEFSRPGFTFELGCGENPLPVSDISEIYDRIKETLLFTLLM